MDGKPALELFDSHLALFETTHTLSMTAEHHAHKRQDAFLVF